MTVQHSFSKIEKELLPAFRQQIGSAESTEDVKKFFVHTISELISRATEEKLKPRYEDITLKTKSPEDSSKFQFSDFITSNSEFDTIWKSSDLSSIMDRFAAAACNRYTHILKNPSKSEAKIRM